MQEIMEWRFKYICEKYCIDISNSDVFELIYKQCKNAKILQGLVVKYNITGKMTIIDALIDKLNTFSVDEKEMLEKCLVIINTIV